RVGNAAGRVGGLRAVERALLEHEAPSCGLLLPDHDAPLVVAELLALERARTLVAVTHDHGTGAEFANDDLRARAAIESIAKRADDRQDGGPIEDGAVRADVEVVVG